MSDNKQINVIELYPKYAECSVCGEETPLGLYMPMYEGKVVDTDKTDEWAGMPVCKGCYERLM